MRGPGILWMLQTAAGMSMAGPMFVVGLEFLRTDRPVAGVGFLALGAVALYFPTYLMNRIGGPRAWIRRRLGRDDSAADEESSADEADSNAEEATDALVIEAEAETDSGGETDAEAETAADASGGTPLLERFRR